MECVGKFRKRFDNLITQRKSPSASIFNTSRRVQAILISVATFALEARYGSATYFSKIIKRKIRCRSPELCGIHRDHQFLAELASSK